MIAMENKLKHCPTGEIWRRWPKLCSFCLQNNMFTSQNDLDHYLEMMYKENISTLNSHTIFLGKAGKTGKTYKKFQCDLPSGIKKFRTKVHIPVLLKKLGILKMEEGMETSHLCHNMHCINPEHLNAEPHHINNNRQTCVNYRIELSDKSFCTGHGAYPKCIPDDWFLWLNKVKFPEFWVYTSHI